MTLAHGHVRTIIDQSYLEYCDICGSFLPKSFTKSEAENKLSAHIKDEHRVSPKIAVDLIPRPLFEPVEKKS